MNSLTQIILHPTIVWQFQQALFHQLLTQRLKSPWQHEKGPLNSLFRISTDWFITFVQHKKHSVPALILCVTPPIRCQIFLLFFLLATLRAFLFLWGEINVSTQFEVINHTSRANTTHLFCLLPWHLLWFYHPCLYPQLASTQPALVSSAHPPDTSRADQRLTTGHWDAKLVNCVCYLNF